MKTFRYLLFLLSLLSVVSCSIEKRHYMSGYNINWKTNTDKRVVKTSDNITNLSKEADDKITYDESMNYPLSTSEDSALTIIILKPQLRYVPTASVQSDTLKSKPKKKAPTKNKKQIDPKKDSTKALLFGIAAFFIFVIGLYFLAFILSFSTFLYLLFLIAMLTEIFAIVLCIIGIVKAIKVLHYLKSHPEENNKNKAKAIIGLITCLSLLIPFIAYWTLILLGGGL